MNNDTDGPGDDSQAPLISGGNVPSDPSVPTYMMDQQNSMPGTPSTDKPTTDTDPFGPNDGAAIDPRSVASDEPAFSRSVVEPAPFDYDTYYAGDPTWPTPERKVEDTVPPAPRRNRDAFMFFIGALAAGVLGAALTVGILAATGSIGSTEAPSTTQAAAVSTSTVEDGQQPITSTIINNDIGAAVNPSAVAVKALPSVVTVSTYEGEGDSATPLGSGSGVVLTEDGYLATNHHVVDGASSWKVTFEDGRIYDAELIGSDELTDLAVLKIEADGLVPIDLGSTDELALGDPAVAVGNPLAQQGGSSVSVGIVSAFDREVEFGDGSRLFGMLQTDAAINQGSSGGALVNADGELIGITSAIGVSNAGPEGIGYAIPVELVRRITDEIIETGDVEHPFLGVQIGDYYQEEFDGATIPAGAEITLIDPPDGAAAAAGLEVGDVVVRIGDEAITSQNDLILAIRLYRVGDEVDFTVVRGGQERTLTVTMGQRPAEFGG